VDIVEAIDRATGCQQCGKALGPSPSDDFCGEGCQHAWHAGRVRDPHFAAAMAATVDQLAQVCGVPRDLLGRADDAEDGVDPPGTVHIRGDGTPHGWLGRFGWRISS
jgi:hypothetical protein